MNSWVRGDVDGDGYSDVVDARSGEVRLYRGSASGFIDAGAVRALPAATAGREIARVVATDAIEDLDGDRRADVVLVLFERRAGSTNGWLRTVVQSSATPSTTLADRSTPIDALDVLQSGVEPRAAGDVDGDGRADMIAGTLVLLAQPLRVIEVAPLLSWRGASGLFSLGDTNRDGRAELWAAPIRHHQAPTFYPAIGVTGASGTSLEWTQRSLRASARPLFASIVGPEHLADVRAADVTGDAALELFATSVRPAMAINAHVPGVAAVWMLQPGGTPTRVTSVTDSGPSPRGDLVLCLDDVNGDGRADLVTRGPLQFTVSEAHRWSFGPSRPTATATAIRGGLIQPGCGRDFNGDGRGDLVAFGPLRASITRMPTIVPW